MLISINFWKCSEGTIIRWHYSALLHVDFFLIAVFMVHYGNTLVEQFRDNWRPFEPNYAENERVLPIKTAQGLDKTFRFVARHIGINRRVLSKAFPETILIKCNPGIVTCYISCSPFNIIIWAGNVNADDNYESVPFGISKYYDGDPHNLEHTIFRVENLASVANFTTERKLKRKRSETHGILHLELIDSGDLTESDISDGDFVNGLQILPRLFHMRDLNDTVFSAKSFSRSCFGKQRQRLNHDEMREIQQVGACKEMERRETVSYYKSYEIGCITTQNIRTTPFFISLYTMFTPIPTIATGGFYPYMPKTFVGLSHQSSPPYVWIQYWLKLLYLYGGKYQLFMPLGFNGYRPFITIFKGNCPQVLQTLFTGFYPCANKKGYESTVNMNKISQWWFGLRSQTIRNFSLAQANLKFHLPTTIQKSEFKKVECREMAVSNDGLETCSIRQ